MFLSAGGQLKLGDFGIARDTGSIDLTDSGMTVGTYAYMAPEQIRGGRLVSDKTDLYALGCLLYEMVTGQQPYRGDNFAVIFDQHLHAQPPRARQLAVDCPPELEQLIVRLLAKDPQQRPFNARYVQGFLQDLLETVSGGEGAGGEELWPVSGRGMANSCPEARQVSWSVLLGFLLLVVGAIGAVVVLRNVAL